MRPSKSTAQKAFTVVIMAMVVTSAIPFGVDLVAGVNGQCTEDMAYTGSLVLGGAAIGGPVGAGAGLIAGAGYFVGSNIADPCWQEDQTLSSDELETLTDNGTYETAVTVIDTRSNEERLIDSMLNTKEFSQMPVWTAAELEAGEAYLNGSDEPGFVNAGTTTIEDAYSQRKWDLSTRYNRDVRNAENTYNKLVEVNQSSLVHVYVNGSEVDTSGGITFSVPTSGNDTANGTAYSIGQERTVQIATVTVGNNTYDFREDLSITMEDPAGEFGEVPIVGYDYLVQNTPVVPDYTEAQATFIVDTSVSDPANTTGVTHNDIDAAVTDAVEGDIIYLRNGTHTMNTVQITKGLTIIGESQAGTTISHGTTYDRVFQIDGSPTDTPVEIRDVSVGLTNSLYLFGYMSSGGAAERPFHLQNVKLTNGAIINGNDKASLLVDVNVTSTAEYRYNNGGGGQVYTQVGAYYGQFHSFTSEMVSEQESDRQELLTEWGTTGQTDGYAHQVWNGLQTDTLSITDLVTYEEMFSNSFSAEDTDSIAFLDAQYLQANMVGHDLRSTAVVEVQAGSSVFADLRASGEVVLGSDKQYSGHMWTKNPPASGSWQTNTTYNTSELGGPVYVTYYQQVEKMTSDGIVVETEPATIAVKGEFQLADIIDGNGTSVDSIDHGGTPRVDPYDPSGYGQTVERVNERNVEIVKTFEDSGTGPTPTCTDGYPIIGCVDGLFASFVGILVAIAAAYILAPRVIVAVIDGLLGR